LNSERQVGCRAQCRLRPGGGRPEVAVVHEARRSISGHGERLAHRSALETHLTAAAGETEAAPLDDERWWFGAAAGDHIDRSAERVRTKQRRPRTVEDLDSLHGVEGNRDVAVVMTGLGIVQPHAVHQHQHLPEVGAANGEVTLDPAHAAHAHVNRRGQAEHVGDRLHRQTLDLLARQNGHRARDGAQFDRACSAGHDHSLPKTILRDCAPARDCDASSERPSPRHRSVSVDTLLGPCTDSARVRGCPEPSIANPADLAF
jgi:hypothetical protein